MARKKGEVQLLREIETQEEWEEVMAMEGIWVIDVYQEWCGPCQALVGSFRRLKNELGDPLLNFAMAKADTIDALEKYRGRCEPTFLFFAGGILTSYIHGADAPKVQRVISEQLSSEHKILEGAGERREVRDPVITRTQEIEIERLAEAEILRLIEAAKYETKPKGVTVAIIKPDVFALGKTEEIIAEMKENEFEILTQEEKELTIEEAKKLYPSLTHETYYDDLIRFMTSGPSYVLLLTRGDSGQTVVKDWKNLLGPDNVEQAREEAYTSLRARYGDKGYLNGLHGSLTKEAAVREQALLFPNYNVPTFQKRKDSIQRTLALIRPEALATKKSAIMQKITDAGFKIDMFKEVQLSKEQAAEFYKEHEQYAYFDSLVENMCSGPILALGLSKDDGIKAWKVALGPSNIDEAMEKAPQSLRAQFPGTGGMNQLHGSESEETAKEELSYFFPMEHTVAVIKPDAICIKDDIIAKINESGFKIAAQHEMMIPSSIVDIMYPNHRDQPYYEDMVNYLTSGPVLFMVLSREGALTGWRLEMGDADPEVAKNTNPESLRALYGKTLLRNTIHGSSSPAHVKREMLAVFGDLKFNEDGTVKGAQPNLEETSQVFQRNNSSDDTGDDVPESNVSVEPPNTDQHVLAEDMQDITDNENNNAEVEFEQRSDTRTDTVQHDDSEEPTRVTQESRTSSETIQADNQEASFQEGEDNSSNNQQELASVYADDQGDTQLEAEGTPAAEEAA